MISNKTKKTNPAIHERKFEIRHGPVHGLIYFPDHVLNLSLFRLVIKARERESARARARFIRNYPGAPFQVRHCVATLLATHARARAHTHTVRHTQHC